METTDDTNLLKRKLRETEARVTSRLIISAQQSLPQEVLGEFMKQFVGNASLDLLQMERDLADVARREKDEVSDISVAAEEYKRSHDRYEEVANQFVGSNHEDEELGALADDAFYERDRKREKLF